MNWLKDIVTGIDGVSYDVVRVLAVIAVAEALGLAAYVVVYKGQAFDMQSYGIGLGAIFVSVGVALKLKQDTEPSVSIKTVTRSDGDTSSTETVK